MTQMVAIATADDIRRLEARIEALHSILSVSTIQPPPEWLTITQAARARGCSESTIRRAIAAGELETNGKAGKEKRVRL